MKAVLTFILGLILVTNADNPIKHLIILMMENRSFDHYLGWLKEELPDLNGLTGDEYNCVEVDDTSSQCVYVNKNALDECQDDPEHDFGDIEIQIYGYEPSSMSDWPEAKMNGFVYDANKVGHSVQNVMSMLTIDNNSAPILNTLALNYAVFDNFFCSVPSSTDPNRAFSMAGTSNGQITNFNGTLWNQQSYFDYLTQNNVSWKGYYDTDLWALGYFEDLSKPPNSLNIYELAQFYTDLQTPDAIPQFTWLQPRLNADAVKGPPNWQHPEASIQEGERLISDVYNALIASDYWNSSALLITYDEHGGFYDHVPPPQTGVPNPDGVKASNGFNFDRLGVRIPTVLVSPWVEQQIISEPCDACKQTGTSQWEGTSYLATSDKLFGVSTPLTDRIGWTATFESYFVNNNLKEPRSDVVKLPEIPKWTDEDILFFHKRPLQEHMKIQVNFYCRYLNLHECPDTEKMNQKDFNDFINIYAPLYVKKIKQME